MSLNNKFIKIGNDVWNVHYIKKIYCNDEYCNVVISYSERNDSLRFTKDTHNKSYNDLKKIYDQYT